MRHFCYFAVDCSETAVSLSFPLVGNPSSIQKDSGPSKRTAGKQVGMTDLMLRSMVYNSPLIISSEVLS
jgi:hypothetical protein